MYTFSASIATTGLSLLLLAAAIPAQTSAPDPAQNQVQNPIQDQASNPAQQTTTVSKVRIVRLSEISGEVQLDRSNGHGLEPAVPNLPVVENNILKTRAGIAEVEFEDNSTLRIGANSEVQFSELGRTSAGSTVSAVRVLRGTAYVSLIKQSSKEIPNQFELAFGERKIQLPSGAHVRLEMTSPAITNPAMTNPEAKNQETTNQQPADQAAKLTVLDGSLRVDGPNGPLDVPHKSTVTFALTGPSEPIVSQNAPANPLDSWDKQSVKLHQRVASLAAFGNAPYAYGLSDMQYYGTFADAGGCGSMWRPYFASSSWSPYSSGVWAYYANSGYSWVSPYPWGWTPYHYGSWNFCSGTGWGWSPGGAWQGINNTGNLTAVSSPIRIKTKGGPTQPIAPPRAPRAGEPSLVAHNLTALVHSGATIGGQDGSGSFVFRKDSAGLGIPRNELGNLRGFSQRADQRGAAATPIFANAGGMAPSAPGGSRGGPINAYAPVAIHRGFAPSPSMGGSSNSSFSSTASRGTTTSSTNSSFASSSSGMSGAHPSAPSGASGSGGAHH
jgi:hypothetical protein